MTRSTAIAAVNAFAEEFCRDSGCTRRGASGTRAPKTGEYLVPEATTFDSAQWRWRGPFAMIADYHPSGILRATLYRTPSSIDVEVTFAPEQARGVGALLAAIWFGNNPGPSHGIEWLGPDPALSGVHNGASIQGMRYFWSVAAEHRHNAWMASYEASKAGAHA